MSRRLLAINPVDHPGGAETTLMRLLAGLADHDWTVELTTPGPGPLRDQAIRAGLGWHRLPLGGLGRAEGARALRSWPAARALAGGHDVVYLNGVVCGRLLPVLSPPALIARRTRARIVLHVHDLVARASRLWRRADLILAASGAVASRLRELDPRLDPHVVYPPVDPEPPEAIAPWSAAAAGGGAIVGFVGRLEPRKGPLDLVRAAPAIKRGAPGTRIVFVGGEPYGLAPEYAALVAGAGDVERYPWSENAPGLMRHLDVLVLPAYREPFGTVLAEAMAVGTPVVATTVDGLSEVVRDGITGRLVAPGDPERLAAAVLEVLSRRAEMGAAARRDAERFHTEHHVRQVESLITR